MSTSISTGLFCLRSQGHQSFYEADPVPTVTPSQDLPLQILSPGKVTQCLGIRHFWRLLEQGVGGNETTLRVHPAGLCIMGSSPAWGPPDQVYEPEIEGGAQQSVQQALQEF